MERAGIAVLVAASLAGAVLIAELAAPTAAYAETTDIYAEADAAQKKVEETAQAYDEAVKKTQEVDGRVQENEKRISAIQRELPKQQETAADAVRVLYKFQQQSNVLIDMVLGASDIDAFLTTCEYMNHIQERNMAEIDALSDMQDELSAVQADLDAAKDEADEALSQAQTALAEAQAAREEAQRKAEEQAAKEAAEVAAALEAEQKRAEEEAAKAAAEGESSDSSSSSSSSVTPAKSDGADWNTDKETFVNEWGPRIDSYLSGSPLAGYGDVFAEAAWDYGVDPRWSPAISCMESSKGLYCFASHNAWGWGTSGWDSWEEAIDAHVRGLARGYGYTISEAGAKKYCPPNWANWYRVVSSEMNKI